MSLLKKLYDKIMSKKELITFYSYESIEKVAKEENKILVTIHDKVYDLTNYKSHPGGFKVIQLCKAKDASEAFEKYHYPLGDARKQMKKYQIGVLELRFTTSDQQGISK